MSRRDLRQWVDADGRLNICTDDAIWALVLTEALTPLVAADNQESDVPEFTASLVSAVLVTIAPLLNERDRLLSEKEKLVECVGEDVWMRCLLDHCFCCPEHPDCDHHESPTGDD